MAPPLFSPAFLALMAMQMAFGFSFSTFLLLPKFMARALGADATTIGVVMSMFGVASLLALPLLGRLIDRRGAHASIIAGNAIQALAAFGFAWVTTVDALPLVLRGLHGVAWTMVFNAGVTMTTQLAPPARLAQAIGIYGSANLVTNAIAPAIAEPLLDRHGPKPVFLAAAVMGLAGLALALRLREPPAPAGGAAPGRGILALLGAPRQRRLAAIMFGSSVGLGVMFSFVQPFALGLGASNVRGFFVGYTAGAVLIRVVAGPLSDRFGHGRLTTLALLLYAGVVGGTALLQPGWLVPCGTLFGVAHGAFLPSFMALAAEGVSGRARAQVFTLMNGCLSAGTALVPLLGMGADAAGFPAIFVGTGVIVLLAALATPRDPR